MSWKTRMTTCQVAALLGVFIGAAYAAVISPNRARIRSSSRAMASGGSSDGVPPPK